MSHIRILWVIWFLDTIGCSALQAKFEPIISQNVSAPESPTTLTEPPASFPSSPSALLGKPSVTSSPKPSLPFPYEPFYKYPDQPSPFLAKLLADTLATAIDIRIVGAAAYLHSCSQTGSQQFTIRLNTPVATGQASSTTERIDLSNVLTEYHDFTNVFSFEGAKTLPEQILKKEPNHLWVIYSLSEAELKALCEFTDETLSSGFIQPTSSSHGAPVLFVKKKSGGCRFPWTQQNHQDHQEKLISITTYHRDKWKTAF